MYTAFTRVSGLKLWSLGDCNCAILLRGAIAQLQSPQVHSFNQSLSLQYVFVCYNIPVWDFHDFIFIFASHPQRQN